MPLGQTQAVPQEAMYSPKQGPRTGRLACPCPMVPTPVCILQVFSMLVDLCFYFRDRRVSSLSVSNS